MPFISAVLRMLPRFVVLVLRSSRLYMGVASVVILCVIFFVCVPFAAALCSRCILFLSDGYK